MFNIKGMTQQEKNMPLDLINGSFIKDANIKQTWLHERKLFCTKGMTVQQGWL